MKGKKGCIIFLCGYMLHPGAARRRLDPLGQRRRPAPHHRDLLQARGLPVRQVAEHLDRQLGDQTVYTDGWANDYTWLSALFEAAE